MKSAKVISWLLILALAPMSAMADRPGSWGGAHWGSPRWHGDIRVFHVHDFSHWRGGNWHHGFHNGAWGWWWVVGGLWYFYPRAVYPYPDPYTPSEYASTGSAPQQFWYFCEASKTYYPYVSSCPGGWKSVPATPQAAPAQ